MIALKPLQCSVIVMLLLMGVAGCSTLPPPPPQPDMRHLTWVNRTVPPELIGYNHGSFLRGVSA